EAFGTPEKRGTWFIAGNTSNGKSTLVAKLVKLLIESFDEKVLYCSLEEIGKASLQKTINEVNMSAVSGKVQYCPKESFDTSVARLKKRDAARVFVIDSYQFTFKTFRQFLKIESENPNVLFIVISQAIKGKIQGKPAEDIQLYADLKIWVEGHRAICKGRHPGPKGYMDIWKEGAFKYWGN
ncbi:MAG: hypothetical protein K2Q33_02840, partial [Gammaproteobacteria bacterium]|nr:hypothetical protein [Gammaproteobacteria bacterium]